MSKNFRGLGNPLGERRLIMDGETDKDTPAILLHIPNGWRSLLWFGIVSSVTWTGLTAIAPVRSQPIPDDTLGAENSRITPDTINGIPSDRIEGGAIRGANLFHSFQEFNINEGAAVYFSNPAGIENILNRVTGGNPSNILGTLGVLGNANLFFINPNGIFFGPNARLDLRGSFLSTTADTVLFDNGFEFSATDPQGPPLLTVNIPIGLRFRENPGSIVNQSIAVDGTGNRIGLQVDPLNSLAIVGGDIRLQGGTLTARQGRIEIGSVAGESIVSFRGFDASYEGVQNFQDIQLLQQALVTTSGPGGGEIQVQGRRVAIADGSQIEANTLGSQAGGSLTVNASESVEIIGRLANGTPSALQTRVEAGATGTGGDLTVNTRRLRVEGGARVAASSLTENNAEGGRLTIRASESVELRGVGQFPNGETAPSQISTVTTGAGKAGNIRIETGQLIATDGGQVSSSTFGSGNAADVSVSANEVRLSGRSPDQTEPSGLLARVESGATGDAGNLTIATRRLNVQGGARVAVSSLGRGNGGDLFVRAEESVEIIGVLPLPDGAPNTSNPSQISALTTGAGNAGDVTIDTPAIVATDGGQVVASTFGAGNAGNLTVIADRVELIGRSPDDTRPSGLLARVEDAEAATGDAGDLRIFTQRLSVRGGARVAASSLGQGDAGNLVVRADDRVEVIGAIALPDGSPNTNNPSQISALTTGTGNGGNVAIETQNLIATDGGQVVASTFGSGNAGTLTVTGVGDRGTLTVPADDIALIGRSSDRTRPSGLLARVEVEEATGEANDVNVVTRRLSVRDGARLAAASRGRGNAGNVRVRASELVEVTTGAEVSVRGLSVGNPGNLRIEGVPGLDRSDIRLDREGSLAASSQSGQGGSIAIDARDILLRRQSQILARGSESGNPTLEGNIDIDAEILVLRDRSVLGTDAANPQGGSNVKIDARTTFVSPDSTIIAAGDLTLETDLEVDPPDVPEVAAIDPNELISQNPCQQGDESEFVITGRGGLPPSPSDPLSYDGVSADLIELVPSGSGGDRERGRSGAGETLTPSPVVPARGWVFNEKGEVVLTSYDPTGIGANRQGRSPKTCPSP